VVIAFARKPFTGTPEQQFEQFKQEFNRQYKSRAEDRIRFQIFKRNLAIAQKLTTDSKGMTEYGVNEFTDLSPEEFRHSYLMPKSFYAKGKTLPKTKEWIAPPNVTLPAPGTIFDWRFPNPTTAYNGHCISPVYNQGQCGSCWAFSATEQIESMSCIGGSTGGNYIQNSMQQVVSCDTTSDGCGGGWTYSAYEYVEQAGGQDSLSSYPYTCQNTACAFNPNTIQSKLASWQWVGQGSEPTMRSYVLSTGPLSICADAESWQYYNGGVIGAGCGQSVDHCIQITGYGQFQGQNVWVVRNSWGTGWGYSGYLYVAYGGNHCDISGYPSTVAAT